MLIGVVALVFLGPRKLPEYARKIGKMMSEFRGTANEFKETWQREVDFSEEAKSLDLNVIDAEPVARVTSINEADANEDRSALLEAPTIKEADPAAFEHLRPAETTPEKKPKKRKKLQKPEELGETPEPKTIYVNDKKNWL